MNRPGKVLVVDDEERNRKLLSRFLQSNGFEVKEAKDGMEALDCVASESPDVILLDVMMPGIDGFEVCRTIKGNDKTAHIPVLLVTMLSERSDRLIGIEAGANDFLSKPVDLDETLLRVRNAALLKRLFDENIFYQQELETLVEERTKDLQQAFEELKSSQEQIIQQEKLATIGQLSAGVAHEINSPATYITLNISYLRKKMEQLKECRDVLSRIPESADAAEREELTKKLESINLEKIIGDMNQSVEDSTDGINRILKIVHSLNTFSRRDSDVLSPADINECIESSLKIVWNELKYKAKIVKDYGEIPKIKCFPQQLSQVVVNLLVNAAHAIEKKGEITIKTFAENNEVVFQISDTGCGISEQNQKKIFEAFFTTKEIGKGTGLGLSIVSKIIEKHEGNISVSSVLGKGTTFTIRLPAS